MANSIPMRLDVDSNTGTLHLLNNLQLHGTVPLTRHLLPRANHPVLQHNIPRRPPRNPRIAKNLPLAAGIRRPARRRAVLKQTGEPLAAVPDLQRPQRRKQTGRVGGELEQVADPLGALLGDQPLRGQRERGELDPPAGARRRDDGREEVGGVGEERRRQVLEPVQLGAGAGEVPADLAVGHADGRSRDYCVEEGF